MHAQCSLWVHLFWCYIWPLRRGGFESLAEVVARSSFFEKEAFESLAILVVSKAVDHYITPLTAIPTDEHVIPHQHTDLQTLPYQCRL